MERGDPFASGPSTAISEDESLLVGLRAGDAASFERLVRDFGPRMMSAIRRVLSDESDAQDALQDAFLSAFRALATFEGQSLLSTWLHRIAVNAALMRLRSKRRRPERKIEDLLPTFLDDGHRFDPKPAWTADAASLLAVAETRAMVRRCIEELPEDYRMTLVLRDIEEIETSETAVILGISPGAVKTRLHRARQALRTLIERELL